MILRVQASLPTFGFFTFEVICLTIARPLVAGSIVHKSCGWKWGLQVECVNTNNKPHHKDGQVCDRHKNKKHWIIIPWSNLINMAMRSPHGCTQQNLRSQAGVVVVVCVCVGGGGGEQYTPATWHS